jgi:dihydroxyacetone kinase
MKKLINDPQRVVEEMMQGFLAMNGGLTLPSEHQVLLRADAEEVRDRQVAVISGGGSGHEPAHAGYIGAGMLTAAVAGEVFTSPSPDSVFAAIQAVGGKPGVLLIVKNYTGALSGARNLIQLARRFQSCRRVRLEVIRVSLQADSTLVADLAYGGEKWIV